MADTDVRTMTTEEQKLYRSHVIGDNVTKIIRDLVKWGAIVFIVYFPCQVLISYSGKITIADVDVKVDARGGLAAETGGAADNGDNFLVARLLSNSVTLGVLGLVFGLAGIAYGRKQASLRREVVKRFHRYQEAEERGRDPNRSSSRLTSRGDTRPEDA